MGGNHKRRGVPIPWPAIRADFIRGMSVTQVAEKHGVSPHTISSRSKRERWSADRKPGTERPLEEQSPVSESLIAQAERAVEANLLRSMDDTLDSTERRRASMIAKAAASTIRDLSTARERQARALRAASAAAERNDVATVIRIVTTPQIIPSIEGHIPGYYGPNNVTQDERWEWMRLHYDENGAFHTTPNLQESNDVHHI